MLSVINPSQMGGPTFPRPTNAVSHHHTTASGSSYISTSASSSSTTLCTNRGSNNASSSNIGSSASCDNLQFQVRSSSDGGRNTHHNISSSISSTNCSTSFNPASSSAELFYFSSSSKNSTCSSSKSNSTTSSSSSASSSSSTSCSRGGMSHHPQNSSQNLFSKPWNPPHLFHPGYRGFQDHHHSQQPHNMPSSHSSAASSSCWLDCLSSTEKVSSSSSYPSIHRRMSTNSSNMMGYNIEQCRGGQQQQQQEHELEKTRKRLSLNNSLFCNPSTSRVTNRSLPQPDGSSSKDFTKPLFVDCSIEYELPNAPRIPKNSKPILMIHPAKTKEVKKEGNSAGDSSSTSKSVNIKEEVEDGEGNNERASKLENSSRTETQNGEDVNATKKVVCTSLKCSCPEAVQYRRKYQQLQMQQQKQKQLHQQQEQKTSYNTKEMITERSSSSSCDNHPNTNKSLQQQQQQQCVNVAGGKRSYAQANMNVREQDCNVGEKRASLNDEGVVTSAFQHPPATCDRNDFYSGNNNNSGRHNQNDNHNVHRQRLQQQNQIRNSSRTGNINNTSSTSNTTTSTTSSTCTINDSSSTTTAFMDRLQYLSKCRSTSSDDRNGSNPPDAKRSRVLYSHQQQQREREMQQERERRHRELQQQQQQEHQRAQQQQETLRQKQEAAVVMAQQQQREHFLHSMRARQHQERQAALSSLAAANLAVYRQGQQTINTTREWRGTGTTSCCWPAYGGSQTQSATTTLSTAASRHQLHQMSSFQQITPPGSMPFCWAPGPAPAHHPSACPPSCCQSIPAAASCRSAGCNTLFATGRRPQAATYSHPHHQDKAASYGMDLATARSKQAASAMAAMASCYAGSNHPSHSNLLPPCAMACAATPALTGGGNPNSVAAAAAAAAMAGAAYCLGCVQGKCQVTWNKENAVNNEILRSL